MRVIAGRLKGRRLPSPEGDDIRPTSDRAREAMFNALGSRLELVDASVVDLFAGTGALGIEAWSRGASSVTFVEQDRQAVRRIGELLDEFGVTGSRVITADALRWVAATPPVVDVVFADPPYAFDEWEALLTPVDAQMVVAESDRPVRAPGWDVVREANYGLTVVTMLEPATQ